MIGIGKPQSISSGLHDRMPGGPHHNV